MARAEQKTQVSPPSKNDFDNLLKDFSAILQRNLEDLFEVSHDHSVIAAVPGVYDGNAQDILLFDNGTNQYLYVKFPSGWKRFTPA